MTDMELLVREALDRNAAEAPTPDALEARALVARTRRRQVLNAIGAGLAAVVIVAGMVGGIDALVSADAPQPATEPTPRIPPGYSLEGPFEPPPQAPIIVGTGNGWGSLLESDRARGWPWMLSISSDGRCLAFTDEQGSSLDCSGPSGDPIDAYVHGPHPAGPSVSFVFGRLPRETNVVRVYVPSRHTSTGKVFVIAAAELNLPYQLFVSYIEKHGYPWIPDATVNAVDTPSNTIIAYTELERPDWARAPFTVLEKVASGVHGLHPFSSEAPEPWEIDIFRDERTGEVCLGEPGGQSACGAPEDPVAGWLSTWSSFEQVNMDSGPMGFAASPQFMWGVFRDPVARIEVEIREFELYGGGAWQTVEHQRYELPAEYGNPLSVFVVDCDCTAVRALTYDRAGNQIDIVRLF